MTDTTTQTAHQAWDAAWKTAEGRAGWQNPDPDVRACAEAEWERGARVALDLGCGVGRHTLYLAALGYETHAFDASEAGLSHAREQAEKGGAAIDFRAGLMTELPYEDGTFDYVLSFNVIYHGDLPTVRRALSEIRRVLKPGGTFQGTMLSKRNGYFGLGEEISLDTFIYDPDGSGDEAHPHFFCSAGELTDLLAGFELYALKDVDHKRRPDHWHWHLVAERLPSD